MRRPYGLALAVAVAVTVLGPGPATAQLTATWTRMQDTESRPEGPGGRGWMRNAYDALARRVVVIGGSSSSYLNDVWNYDLAADRWTMLEPFVDCPALQALVPPPKRDEHVVEYDPVNHRYWMYGGSGFGCKGASRTAGPGTTTTSIVDGTLGSEVDDFYRHWTVQVGGAKAYVAAYQASTRTLTLATPISGLAPGTTYQVYPNRGGGTWHYSPPTRTWIGWDNPAFGYTGPLPINRFSPGFAYSSADQVILMFGGGGRNDTWALDVAGQAWVRLNPPTSPPPLSQIQNSMVYDEHHDVFVLFGGECKSASACGTYNGLVADTWTYHLPTNTWRRTNPPVRPSARKQHQMAYDADRRLVVMYGGRNSAGVTLGDLWVYDYAADRWTQLTATPSPPPLRLGSLVYDREQRASVLYGANREVWALRLEGEGGSDPPPPPPPPPAEQVVDNAPVGVQDPAGGRTFTGTWCRSLATNQYGPDSLYSCGSGSDTYTWTATLPAAGRYEVHVWWSTHPNRGTAVPITVTHAGGSTTRTYNQRSGGGQWVLHGTYDFATVDGTVRAIVRVSDSGGQAAADAVRVSPAP